MLKKARRALRGICQVRRTQNHELPVLSIISGGGGGGGVLACSHVSIFLHAAVIAWLFLSFWCFPSPRVSVQNTWLSTHQASVRIPRGLIVPDGQPPLPHLSGYKRTSKPASWPSVALPHSCLHPAPWTPITPPRRLHQTSCGSGSSWRDCSQR